MADADTGLSKRSVFSLPATLAGMPAHERRRWSELYTIEVVDGRCSVPPTLVPKVTSWFSQTSDEDKSECAIARVQGQRVLRVWNIRSCEEAAFNSLRTSRPQVCSSTAADDAHAALQKLYAESAGKTKCDFCAATERTCADEWGRVQGVTGCITASNVAKASDAHGIVILPAHHPLELSADIVADVFGTAHKWAVRTIEHRLKNTPPHSPQSCQNGADGPAVQSWHPLLLWNCGMGSGASMPHGHAQVILGHGRLFGFAEAARRHADEHGMCTGRCYWDDMLWCHQRVGLAVEIPAATPVHLIVHLTPRASREIIVFARELSELGRGVHFAVQQLQGQFGARCMSIASALPILWSGGDDASGRVTTARGHADTMCGKPDPIIHGSPDAPWLVARVLDRTAYPTAAGSIYGTALATWELYGPAVDDCDPHHTIDLLRQAAASLPQS